eukprot:1800443-Alexandrium_andersonii.AAC.1
MRCTDTQPAEPTCSKFHHQPGLRVSIVANVLPASNTLTTTSLSSSSIPATTVSTLPRGGCTPGRNGTPTPCQLFLQPRDGSGPTSRTYPAGCLSCGASGPGGSGATGAGSGVAALGGLGGSDTTDT